VLPEAPGTKIFGGRKLRFGAKATSWLALHRRFGCALEVGDEAVLRRTMRDGPVAEATHALLVSCACGPATSWKARLDTGGLLRPRPARSFLGRAP
jgi:hypothetical protein